MDSPPGYRLGKPVHLGERSEVRMGVRERDGLEVVLKGFRAAESDAEGRARNELAMLQKVEGPGVVAALELTHAAEMPVLVLRHVPGVSLDSWVGTSLPAFDALLTVF